MIDGEKTKHYADAHNSKIVFSAIKAVYCSTAKTNSCLLLAAGEEHYKYSMERTFQHLAKHTLHSRPQDPGPDPQRPVLQSLELSPIEEEIVKVIW